MKVFKTGEKERSGRHLMFVEPGRESDVADWKDQEGAPMQFTVEFINGEAKVADNLGRYLVEHGLAQKTPLILSAH